MRKNSASPTTDHFPDAGEKPSSEDRVSNATPTVGHLTTVALLPGADSNPELANDWQPSEDGAPAYRCVWSPAITPVAGTAHEIRCVVIQFSDGTIGTEGSDAPTVYVGNDEYSPADARRVADALKNAADLAEQWAVVGNPTAEENSSPDPHVLLVEQNDEGTDRCEVVCRPFEPQFAGYDGERFLSIAWDGNVESFVVVSRTQAADLARMLIGGAR